MKFAWKSFLFTLFWAERMAQDYTDEHVVRLDQKSFPGELSKFPNFILFYEEK